MEVKGYKAFDKNFNNRYGCSFEEGQTYFVTGKISFGNNGNGFHFCERLEDTLRYVDGMNEDVKIAEVIGFGECVTINDEYYGYFDMHAAGKLKVVRIVPKNEILSMYINCSDSNRIKRFVSGYRLTDEEKEMFRLAHMNKADVLQAIDYYQDGKKDAYEVENYKKYYKSFN